MTKKEIKYCMDLLMDDATNNKVVRNFRDVQTVKDFNESMMFDFRKNQIYHTTSDKVVNLIRTRCMNLHGRINPKEFNKLVPFLLNNVVVYDIDI